MPIAESARLAPSVKVFQPTLVNLYGCTVGDDTKIGAFVEIQKNATIGARCKISSHTFICEGVVIEDEVFIGHGVMFTNDRFPRATNRRRLACRPRPTGRSEVTRVRRGASIGTQRDHHFAASRSARAHWSGPAPSSPRTYRTSR